jgi:hypothetical protein
MVADQGPGVIDLTSELIGSIAAGADPKVPRITAGCPANQAGDPYATGRARRSR